jgi:phosphoribosylformimino-5-aminoimidazole carboxamide ribotide isomerase
MRACVRAMGVRCHAHGAPVAASASYGAAKRAVQFRPCIDIHNGKVKQIVGSTLKDSGDVSAETPATNFETETPSSEYAEMYKRDGIYGGHAILLSKDDATMRAAQEATRAFPGGLQVGGGVNPTNAGVLLDAGASHVIVTSYVFRDGALNEQALREMVNAVGAKRLVLDLSCRKDANDGKYKVVTDRWQKWTDLAVDGATMERLAECCDEFLVHGVDVEGMKLGIDLDLVELLGQFCPIPVTYAGGARSLQDLDLVKVAGRGMVDITVGSALDCFGGALKYDDVVAWHNEQKLLLA